MTTVAKGIDAPILLQMPQDIYRNGWRDASKHAMLGSHIFILFYFSFETVAYNFKCLLSNI